MCTDSLWGDEGRLPQRWSCGGRGAENRPSQSHCRSGSKGEFAPGVEEKCCVKFTFPFWRTIKTQCSLLLLDSRVCPWWWGWRHTGRASHPPPCRLQSEPAPSSPPGTAGTRILGNIHPQRQREHSDCIINAINIHRRLIYRRQSFTASRLEAINV